MRFAKESVSWKITIGSCPCLVSSNDIGKWNISIECLDLPCPSNTLRGFLVGQGGTPTRAAFVEALIRTGELTRKQIFSALQEFLGVKARKTCEWHLQDAIHKMKDRGIKVRRVYGIYKIQ